MGEAVAADVADSRRLAFLRDRALVNEGRKRSYGTQIGAVQDGVQIVGHPRRAPAPGRAPAVVLTGPFTGANERVAGLYAQKLTATEFVTPTFDHRGFGDSGGRPDRLMILRKCHSRSCAGRK